MVARAHKLDIIGFMTLAIVAALGGGMMRDALLMVGPPLALEDPWYIPAAVIAAIVAWMIPFQTRAWRISSGVLDGLVIGVWAATGTVKTLTHGFAWPPAILLGVMTAVGGGMLRDLMVGRIPAIFGGSHLYATSALLGSFVALGFFHVGLPNIGLIVSALVACGFFLLSRWFRWKLPQGGEDLGRALSSTEWLRRRSRGDDADPARS
ncbi:MAG TPA: trimeric intracellular cation channel family protein [Actinomycetales bacterium]|nr:trimeric intracellular cation channel family protein [Actinomycetales bacterium]